MKPTDFAKHLTEFLSNYLLAQKNVSKNTILSYRDTFKLLIKYCQEERNLPVERMTLNIISSECLINFLEWLETNRKCSTATRNQRLAAARQVERQQTVGRDVQRAVRTPRMVVDLRRHAGHRADQQHR